MLTPIVFLAAWRVLTSASHVLIILQDDTDGDNVGSSLALAHALRNAGRSVAITCIKEVASTWDFLPGVRSFVVPLVRARDTVWDVAVVTDTSDIGYGGIEGVLDTLVVRPTLVNLDHHATNTQFGDVNVVDAEAAAAAEVVTDLLRAVRCPITADIATCLLAGLFADTGFLTNPATSERALATAAFLLTNGAQHPRLLDALLKQKTPAILRFWGIVLERLFLHPSGLGVTVITADDLAEAHLPAEAVEGVANFLNVFGAARAICVLREDPRGMIKGSLRTTRDDTDVSRLALFFGGGGHKKAAGFRVPGRLILTAQGYQVAPPPLRA